MEIVHGTSVSIDGRSVLLRGPSGAGKSALALNLIDHGARLVADDQVIVRNQGATLVATAPPSLAGLLEIRGYGIVSLPALDEAVIYRVIDLQPSHDNSGDPVERYPEPDSVEILGISIPRAELDPFSVFAVPTLRAILRYDRCETH